MRNQLTIVGACVAALMIAGAANAREHTEMLKSADERYKHHVREYPGGAKKDQRTDFDDVGSGYSVYRVPGDSRANADRQRYQHADTDRRDRTNTRDQYAYHDPDYEGVADLRANRCEASSSVDRDFVQVGAFRSAANASRAKRELTNDSGMGSRDVEICWSRERRVYRVRIIVREHAATGGVQRSEHRYPAEYDRCDSGNLINQNVVQFGAFRSPENARRARRDLAHDIGVDRRDVEICWSRERHVYRVRIVVRERNRKSGRLYRACQHGWYHDRHTARECWKYTQRHGA